MPQAQEGEGQDLVPFLAKCQFFDHICAAELPRLLQAGRVQRVARGDVLFRQGAASTRVYVLVNGTATLVRAASKGHRIVLALLRGGDTFGFLDLVGRADPAYTAEIVEAGQVLSWSHETMRRMIVRYPVILNNAMSVMARRMELYWLRIEDLATVPVERRAARTLIRLTNGTNRRVFLLHRDLAELLDTTPPTLSRILHQWRRRGWVKVDRTNLQLLKPDEVRALAEDP